ncbi:MAG: hypothetical protein LBD28_04335, partial [Tannerellaceae bacterium]|nr:hypothetical protein [Tannerellaceae bacterium]
MVVRKAESSIASLTETFRKVESSIDPPAETSNNVGSSIDLPAETSNNVGSSIDPRGKLPTMLASSKICPKSPHAMPLQSPPAMIVSAIREDVVPDADAVSKGH